MSKNNNVSKMEAKVSKMDTQNESKENKVTRLEDYLKARYEFQYNEVTKDTEFRIKGEKKFVPIDDRFIAGLRIELQKKNFTGFKGLLDDLLKSPYFSTNFNPFKSYFENLPKWNGNDFISELTDHIRLKDPKQRKWFRKMFRKHLMRTVACALRMLPFNKHCFVFLGKQNDGKSSLVRFLCPEVLRDYYKENPPLDHKDSIIALSQNFLINLDELSNMDKAEANKIKSLFSQADTKVRRHYATKDTLQHRYASFFGTTNEPEFLNDVTGNVRWLIFEIDGIEHDNGGLNGYTQRINIDNVWAQAYALVMAGESCELTSDEIKEVERLNKKYQRSTAEMDTVGKYFSESEKGKPNTFALTASDIQRAIQSVTKTSSNFNYQNVGRALTHLGINKKSIRIPSQNNPVYRYLVTSTNQEILNFLYSDPDYTTTNLIND